jgi:uncharacterized membrane protein
MLMAAVFSQRCSGARPRSQVRERQHVAIRIVGTGLAAHFPAVPGDRDELANELRILD